MLATGDPPGEPLLVESTSDTQLAPNGSLVFPQVQPHLQGHYTCRASNDIGQPLSKTVFLRVNGECAGAGLGHFKKNPDKI